MSAITTVISDVTHERCEPEGDLYDACLILSENLGNVQLILSQHDVYEDIDEADKLFPLRMIYLDSDDIEELDQAVDRAREHRQYQKCSNYYCFFLALRCHLPHALFTRLVRLLAYSYCKCMPKNEKVEELLRWYGYTDSFISRHY